MTNPWLDRRKKRLERQYYKTIDWWYASNAPYAYPLSYPPKQAPDPADYDDEDEDDY